MYDEFLENFSASVRDRQIGEVDHEQILPVFPREEAFTEMFLAKLTEGGELPDLDIAYFRGKLGRANGQVNAFGISENDGRMDLVVTIHGGADWEEPSAPIPAREVEAAAKRALHVFRSARESIHAEMEPSSAAADMFERIHRVHEGISQIRVIVLVDGEARIPEWEQPGDLPTVKLDVWDHLRLYRVCASGLPYESVTIDIKERIGVSLECIISDVDVDDHECFLTIIPGDLLHDLYDEFGARLLELNVRSFLQARGKVNRGIRDTLKNDPDHFLAFNNGISATVEEIEFERKSDGSRGIVRMKGFQIVNGGQTMASIHRAKQRDGSDLSRVRVQTKITVVQPEFLETLVPNISRFSNTQNKVNETDFSANHPYHIRLQQLSEQVWAPGGITRWFYERARGQFEVARAKDGSTPARLRAFDAKTPRKKKIDKTLLARSENSWGQKPHLVSRGGQKNFIDFMTNVRDTLPDEQGYREIVARVILFKASEKIARQIGFSAYRANAVCYTVSLLAYRTTSRIDLEEIWRDQAISPLLENLLREWMPQVHEAITQTAGGRNVTEWAKKLDCWATIQNLPVKIQDELQEKLRSGLPLPNVGAFKEGGKVRELTEEEIHRQETVMAMTAEDFASLFVRVSRHLDTRGMQPMAWAAMIGCISTVQTYAQNGWTKVHTPKQTKQIHKALAFLANRGQEANDGEE